MINKDSTFINNLTKLTYFGFFIVFIASVIFFLFASIVEVYIAFYLFDAFLLTGQLNGFFVPFLGLAFILHGFAAAYLGLFFLYNQTPQPT